MSVVFALATPPAKSAICVFRVTGDGCHKVLKKISEISGVITSFISENRLENKENLIFS